VSVFQQVPRRILFFLDSCQSGGALDSLAKVGRSLRDLEMQASDSDQQSKTSRDNGVGFILYASASPINTVGMPPSGPTSLASQLEKVIGESKTASPWSSELLKDVLPDGPSTDRSMERPLFTKIGFDFPMFGLEKGEQ
jgi:hypothetical protein